MMSSRKEIKTSRDILEKFNAKNAKLLAFTLVIAFTLFHGVRHLRYRVDSCTLVLSDGRYNGKSHWHPVGCMLHVFSYTDTKKCFKLLQFLGHRNIITFVGDRHMRLLYEAFVKSLKEDASADRDAFIDHRLGLRVQYHPALTLPELFDEIRTVSKTEPRLAVIGYGPESLVGFSRPSFRYNLTLAVSVLDALSSQGATVVWPLAEPNVPGTLQANDSTIDQANRDTVEILHLSSTRVFAAHRKLTEPFEQEMETRGVLPWDHVARRSAAQILLNVYCNDHMNFQDGSCCSSGEGATTLQLLSLATLLLCFVLLCVAILHAWCTRWRRYDALSTDVLGGDSPSRLPPAITALGKLAIIMVYFYVCDRTNLFMKESKYYSRYTFWIPVVYVFCVGLFFTEESRSSKVLHRDQTDEWKGWMQMVVLIYHWTDSAQVLPLYLGMRVIASTYLFLTGYGHFTYFLHTADVSITRFFQVLFRLNFLVILLCLVMNRPYQFYAYIPVISFWYLMIAIWLALPPRVTAVSSDSHPVHYLYLVLKFVGLFVVITTLYMSEVFFEKIFVTRPWKALFVTTDDDIHAWWYRWKLDRYCACAGMVLAAALHIGMRAGLVNDTTHGNLFSNGIALSATLAALTGIGSYTTFAVLCRDRQDCDEIHAYAACIPIVSYIILRNISGVLRSRISSLFCWVGRVSLELYVAQPHIWLAADAAGVLVLLPHYPHLNAACTTFIFICVAHEVREITNTLLPYAVPTESLQVVRNLLLFGAILVPIGVHDGMF